MISWLSNWAQGIIIALVIATIIEMILPKSSLKKYIKVVIGIYILFTMVSPIIDKIYGGKVEINNIFNTSKYSTKLDESNDRVSKQLDNNNNKTIKDIYIENLENDMKSRLKQKKYQVNNVYIKAQDDESYTITEIKVYLNAETKTENVVNEVKIHINEISVNSNEEDNESSEVKNNVDFKVQDEIKRYLAETYSLSDEMITVF